MSKVGVHRSVEWCFKWIYKIDILYDCESRCVHWHLIEVCRSSGARKLVRIPILCTIVMPTFPWLETVSINFFFCGARHNSSIHTRCACSCYKCPIPSPHNPNWHEKEKQQSRKTETVTIEPITYFSFSWTRKSSQNESVKRGGWWRIWRASCELLQMIIGEPCHG